MDILNSYTFAFLISVCVTILSTPLMKQLAFKLNVVDKPDHDRKVHDNIMPYMGGGAIILGFIAGYIYLQPQFQFMTAFLIGAGIIALTGFLDDKFAISPKLKLLGQIMAAVIVVSSGIQIEFIRIPMIGEIHFGWLAIPFTLFWIIAITNAINLIDGLDGLATGVSSIALTSIIIMSALNNQILPIGLSVLLLGGTLGFLLFNFNPAKIFMGDTGSLFIGYALSVISILGMFKSITIFSLIIPIMILAVPIFDTSFAIIRRLIKKQKISAPDKSHLHHHLLNIGFSHKTTVLIIYIISAFFGFSGIVFSRSVLWGSLLFLVLAVIMFQFTMEIIDVLNKRRKPILNTVKKVILNQSSSRGK
ncbi:glycosyltransferase family 4 protein [Tuberibacillus sp. Marseille-P3662]|uniref:glycosyltransferase family 4 protein n=1 Tax=Tuberibacillus sp. Marseille-P3662 TaxID=1965358 RepID=UPI000A1CC99F|nr:MraY family glycosyltransferase [Tuberibacillus sp. Marseille-P3662]